MSPTKHVLYELAEGLREMMGGSKSSEPDNPADTFFSTASDVSSSSSSDESNIDPDQTMDELFSMTLDEEDF